MGKNCAYKTGFKGEKSRVLLAASNSDFQTKSREIRHDGWPTNKGCASNSRDICKQHSVHHVISTNRIVTERYVKEWPGFRFYLTETICITEPYCLDLVGSLAASMWKMCFFCTRHASCLGRSAKVLKNTLITLFTVCQVKFYHYKVSVFKTK